MTITSGERTSNGWTVDDSTFGARLALIRQRMDWNIKEAALACGIPAASWKNWERGSSLPRRHVEVATVIAGRTGCNRKWLLMGPGADLAISEPTVTTLPRSPLAAVSRPPGHPGRPDHLIRTGPARSITAGRAA